MTASIDANAPGALKSSAGRRRGETVSFDDRVLAEAVDVLERGGQEAIDDAHANSAARAADGDLEHRIATRAKSLPIASSLQSAIHHVRLALGWIIAAGAMLVLLAGAATARATLGSPSDVPGREPVNFFWVLGSVLGLQTFILVLWLSLVLILPRILARRAAQRSEPLDPADQAASTLSVASLGGLVVRAAQRVAGWLHKGPIHAAAILAVGGVNTRGRIGKWTLSAISNGLWLSFNVGCLVLVILLLSTRQYTFAWETTILSDSAYKPLTKAVAALPKLAGFPVPSDEQITASQWRGNAGDQFAGAQASQAWAGLLVGSIVLYGLGPRLLLLGFCLGKRRAARKKYRLRIDSPGYLRLEPLLMPASESLGVIDQDDSAATSEFMTQRVAPHPARPIGPPAIVGLEISRPQTPWPPKLNALVLQDLGMIEGGDDQHHLLKQLRESPSEPRTLIVACGLTTTPDRGIASFLRALQSTVATPVVLVLTGGQTLRQRGGIEQLTGRISDWRTLGQSVAIDNSRIVELDLDHLTHASAERLARTIDSSAGPSTAVTRRIEKSFELINQHAAKWLVSGGADLTAQADLQRHIAGVYRDEPRDWQSFLRLPSTLKGDVIPQLRSGADRILDLLPTRLRRSPKWLAAGGIAGALSCVTAATLISPVAIASLPIWSAIGAAIAAIAQPSGPSGRDSSRADSVSDAGGAVRAAALFALLLELQGRDEASITRILDQVIEDEREPITDDHELRSWLDHLRHRYDIALASEVRP